MTTITPADQGASLEAPVKTTRRSALSARRVFLVASPVLAGLFAVLGAAADPAAGQSGRELYQNYAANPDVLQWKSIGFHWSYAFWITPAMLLAAYVRDRGSWLANVGAFLGFVGATSLPGLLFVDYYDSAIGQVAGVDTAVEVTRLIEDTMWGAGVLAVPGIAGLMLALPVAAVAAWRGGIVRWWAPLAVVAGFLAFSISGVMWWGCVITTAFFAVFAYEVARGTRP
ncbi:hypothetical protein [Kribbella swartbergensis]